MTSSGGTPTGTVTFKDGTTTLGTGTLSSGTATYTTSALTLNSHSITAVYEGDTNYTVSTSSVLTQTIMGNGTCGSSNGLTLTAAPTATLCSMGSASAVTGSGPWSWTCDGVNGGTTVNCSASIQTYTITPTVSSGGTINPTSRTINHGSTTTFTVTPDSGYQIASVTGCGGTLNGDTFTTGAISGNCSITAGVESNAYALTVDLSGSGIVSSSPSGISCGSDCTETYPYNSTVTLTASPADGYVFSGWSGACTGTETTCAVTMDAAKAVTATFASEPAMYNLSFYVRGGGSVTADGLTCNGWGECTGTYEEGSVVTLTAVPYHSDYIFKWNGHFGFSCESVDGDKCTIIIDADKSAEITFYTKDEVIVTVKGADYISGKAWIGFEVKGEGTWICSREECMLPYSKNDLVKLKAHPSVGWKFIGWEGSCSGNKPTCQFKITQVSEVTASFEVIPHFELKVTKSGNGTGTVTSSPKGMTKAISCNGICNEDSANYAENKPVTLIAKPDRGSKFSGWSGGGCSGIKPKCKITKMDSDKDVTATFGKPDISISTDSIDFSDVTKKTTSTQTFIINNNGDADLKVASMKLSGKGASMYKLYNSSTGRAVSTATITYGDSLTIEVRFKPTTTGDKPATLTINSDDPATPKTSVSLSGTGK